MQRGITLNLGMCTLDFGLQIARNTVVSLMSECMQAKLEHDNAYFHILEAWQTKFFTTHFKKIIVGCFKNFSQKFMHMTLTRARVLSKKKKPLFCHMR